MSLFKKLTISSFTLILIGLLIAAPAFAVRLPPPLGDASVIEITSRVIKGALGLVSIVALINFIIAGFRLILSGGAAERVKKARDNLVWTTFGILLLFGSYALVSYVFDVLMNASGAPK